MARGKWLSEDEKAEITRMRAGGMTIAQIATQMQRGVKTIQRVLNGKHTSEQDAGSPSPGGSGVPQGDAVPHKEAPGPPVPVPCAAPKDIPGDAAATAPVRNTQIPELNARLQQHQVQKTKPPTRPKKLPRQAAVSSPARGVALAEQSPQVQRPIAWTADTTPQSGHECSVVGFQQPAVVAAVLEPSARTTTSASARMYQAVESAAPQSTVPASQSPLRRQSTTLNAALRTPYQGNVQDIPVVIPDEHLSVQQERTLEDEIESMANVVSDDESDNGACASLHGPPRASLDSPRQAQEVAITAWPTDRRPNQVCHQNEAERVPLATPSALSPLCSFESQLHSSQASLWSASASQIEPEPMVTKKRKVATLEPAQGDQDPIERALAAFHGIISTDTAVSKQDVHGQRLVLLFHRFQADVRLVQLEKKLDQTTGANTTFSI